MWSNKKNYLMIMCEWGKLTDLDVIFISNCVEKFWFIFRWFTSFIRNKLKWHLYIHASHYDVWVMWINTSLAGSWKFFFIKSTNIFLWLVSVIFQANGFETSERSRKIIFQEPQKPHFRKCHHFAIDYNFLF